MTGLRELIRPELVLVSPEASTAEDVIRQLAGLLVAQGFAHDTLAEAVLAREEKYPTGLFLGTDELNAAIPHADSEHVITAAVAIATLATPVSFHRMDDPAASTSVRFVALLALADADSQLATLREVGGVLQDPTRIAAIVGATSVEQLLAELLPEPAGA